MAYTAGNLHLRAGAPGDLTYTYDATADTLATVATAGYFNNTDDDLNFVADDLIFVQAGDGNMWLRVSAISSGSVTTQFAGGNMPVQTPATGTAAAHSTEVFVGQYEIGTSISSASRFILPIPYPGAEMMFRKVDSGTAAFFVDAGGSATAALGTSITYDSVGNRRFVMQQEGETFHGRATAGSCCVIRVRASTLLAARLRAGAS
ncbi:hypothetical protein LCGC14_0611900 [marine sediment metagenome]|uniref:Uncharacterized protein n=1 Tax=marine sediment metagenome TaxID=412755 RepID=A0A0F9TTP8_9ZZZZ